MKELSFMTDSSREEDYVRMISMILEPFDLKLELVYPKSSSEEVNEVAVKDRKGKLISKIKYKDLLFNDPTKVDISDTKKVFFWGSWIEISEKDRGKFHVSFKYNYRAASVWDIMNFHSNLYRPKHIPCICEVNEFKISRNAPDESWTEWMAFVLDSDEIHYDKETNTLSFVKNDCYTDIQKIEISDNKNGVYTITLERKINSEEKKLKFVYIMPNKKTKGTYSVIYKENKNNTETIIEKGTFDGDPHSMIINNRLVRNCVEEIQKVYKHSIPKFTLTKDIMKKYPFVLPLKEAKRCDKEAQKYFEMIGDYQIFNTVSKSYQRTRKSVKQTTK